MKDLSILIVCFIILLENGTAQGRSAQEWKSRVIYQVVTDRFAFDNASSSSSSCTDLDDYCTGTFRGIINKLDYIKGLGMNAIWISPIPVQTDKGFHGYWQKDITHINPHFGSGSDLKELVDKCHQEDIWVMLDVVGNHMGNQNNGDWNNFTPFYPFNQSQHYHSYCPITDFTNQQQVEVCRLANLPDLNQSNNFVRSTLTQWVQKIVQQYGIDGIRIDTVPEVHKDFWTEYTQSAGVYSVGEVFNGDPKYVSGYQGYVDGTLNYPMYYKLVDAFQKKNSMRSIHNGVSQNSVFKDVSVLGNFIDNHDNDRFLHNQKDWNLLKNALAYIIYAEGIPIIYYGTEQTFSGDAGYQHNRESLWPHYDTNSDLYTFISTLAVFRQKMTSDFYNSEQVERYVDDQLFAFTRGMVFVATTNIGSGQSLTQTITYHPYSDGTNLVSLLDPESPAVEVNGGKFDVSIQNGMPVIYTPK